MKVKVIQTDIKMYSLVIPVIIPRLEVNVWIQANTNVSKGHHKSMVLSLEYCMSKIKWVRSSSYQQVSTVYYIPSKSIEDFVK